jgi:mannose/fructose-specific phosphotransferase system component IIA
MKASPFVVIVSHENLSFEIKSLVEKLTHTNDIIHCYTNQKESLEILEKQILDDISHAQPKHILLLADLVGGSCWFLANKIKKSLPETVVIGGVNIPLMVSFLMNYEKMEWEQLINKIVEDGRKGIIVR